MLTTSNKYRITFHHLGLVVKNAEASIKLLRGLGYEIGHWIFDPLQDVNLAMCSHPTEPNVEIVCPIKEPSHLDKLIVQQPDGLIYHVCYTTDDLGATLDSIEDDGLRVFCISSPKPAVLFGGREVSFYRVEGLGLIELLDLGSPQHM